MHINNLDAILCGGTVYKRETPLFPAPLTTMQFDHVREVLIGVRVCFHIVHVRGTVNIVQSYRVVYHRG